MWYTASCIGKVHRAIWYICSEPGNEKAGSQTVWRESYSLAHSADHATRIRTLELTSIRDVLYVDWPSTTCTYTQPIYYIIILDSGIEDFKDENLLTLSGRAGTEASLSS